VKDGWWNVDPCVLSHREIEGKHSGVLLHSGLTLDEHNVLYVSEVRKEDFKNFYHNEIINVWGNRYA
jgi:hypothetical protein